MKMMLEAIYVLLAGVIIITAILLTVSLIARGLFKRQRSFRNGLHIGVFHPYCNAGGGGERVLWCAVRALQTTYPDAKIVIYTGDLDASRDEILSKAEERFSIKVKDTIEFVYLHKRTCVEAKLYPHFTLLGQSLGSVLLGMEALLAFLPDVYIDTMGYSFTLPLFSLIGDCKTGCYIHYPTISYDMLSLVSSRRTAHNNRGEVASSSILSFAKLLYYHCFAWLYGLCGSLFTDTIMVNSSWTEEHINSLWKCPDRTHRVYPPCDVKSLKEFKRVPHDDEKEIRIISIGQFRPEKDHPLQLKALYQLREIVSKESWDKIKLVLVGSCRNADDEIRAQDIKDLCKHLSISDNVEFKLNVSYDELKTELQCGTIGLHAMWNEHFGIGVVECMAAGLIMLAHKSGGPKMDIVNEFEGTRNGFLAADEHEYAKAIADIIKLPAEALHKIRESARSTVDRFSPEEFEKSFLEAVEPLFTGYKKGS